MRYGERRFSLWSAAWPLEVVAAYLALFGIGTARWSVVSLAAVLAVALLLARAVQLVVATYIRLRPAWIQGTARVMSASEPPEKGTSGVCALDLLVEAPGQPPTTVQIRDRKVPRDRWPEIGQILHVRFPAGVPGRVRVRWDAARSTPPWDAEPRGVDAALHAQLREQPYEDLDDADAGPDWRDEDLTAFAPPPYRPSLAREPSDLVVRYLFPTEKFRGEWRRHAFSVIRSALVWLTLASLGTVAVRQRIGPQYMAGTVLLICVAGAGVTLYAMIAWHFRRFVLTNRRVLLVEGISRRRASQVALARITDMRYEQSTLGRILGYGDFIIDGVRWHNRMHRISDLPNPTDIYLQVVEELYEPEAAEARRQPFPEDLGGPEWPGPVSPVPVSPAPTSVESLTVAFREAIYGPALTNYDGWVSVDVRVDGQSLPISEDRHVELRPGMRYELCVRIAPEPADGTSEPLRVTGGVYRDVVEFNVEVDSDVRALRCPSVVLPVEEEGNSASFVIQLPPGTLPEPPWLWIRVSQNHRLLQSIELATTMSLL